MQIHTLDLSFQDRSNTIASYLVEGPDGPVLVETGPGSTQLKLKEGLARHGYRPADIGHVLVTHIHLDHAGSAGWLAQQGAQVYVHHVGAPHLIDPSKLLSSARRIYGDQMGPLWGETLPAPAEKVTAVRDGDELEVAGLAFTALDTPGHASHHHVYRLGDIAFTGDAAGIQLPGPFLPDLPAPPPEFNLELWLKSVELLLAQSFDVIYPTHFDRLDNWRHHLEVFAVLLQEAADFVRTRMEANLSREEIVKQYSEWQTTRAEDAQVPGEIMDRYGVVNPLYMSVDGIMRYWRRKLEWTARHSPTSLS